MIPVTSLAEYIYCPRKCYLTFVLGHKEPPKDVILKGTIKHAVFDEINKIDELLVKDIKAFLTEDEIFSIYKKNYYKLLTKSIMNYKKEIENLKLDSAQLFQEMWPFFLPEAEVRAKTIFNFIKEKNLFGNELWEALTPKFLTEHRLASQKLNLTGVVDRVEVHKETQIPVELKTGKTPREGVWPGHKVQIGAYVLLLAEKLGKEIKEGVVHYVQDNKKRKVVMNPMFEEEIKTLIGEIEDLLKSKEVPVISKNKNKCNVCGLKELCEEKV